MPISFRDKESKTTAAQRQTQLRGRAIRRRMFFLVATLLLVLVLMREARKPENYAWLTKLQRQGETPGNVRDITDEVHHPSNSNSTRESESKATEKNSKKTAEISTDSSQLTKPKSPGNASRDLWARFLAPLTAAEQVVWFQLLTLDSDVVSEESTARALIAKFQTELDHAMSEALKFSARATEQSQADMERITSVRNSWEHSVKPTWEALLRGDPTTPEQQQAVSDWAEEVNAHAVDLIDDLTEVARPSDSLAWLLTWRRLMKQSPNASPKVSIFELMAQPEVYRSQPIYLQGTLRGVESTAAGPNPFGIERFWVLWVQPGDMNSTPFCVYAADLGDDLLGDPERFLKVRLPIELHGIFWKVRTYVDTQNEISSCPLILARTVTPKAIRAAPEPYRWQPTIWLLWSLIGLMPLLAIAIAWRIARSGKIHLNPESPSKTQQLHASLENLQTDSSIMNDRQRIAKLRAEQGDA